MLKGNRKHRAEKLSESPPERYNITKEMMPMGIGDIISLLRLIAYVVFEVLKAIKPKHKK